jgi:MOSC domain-containing protein YiiM
VIHQINISADGVPKLPVDEASVTRLGIVGDGHDDTENHGGPLAALCLYSLEVIERLQAEGHPIAPGTTGENVTLAGVDWSAMTPGARLALGDEVVIELTDYVTPCKTISKSFVDQEFVRVSQKLRLAEAASRRSCVSQKLHPGESRIYARILRAGLIRPRVEARLLSADVP